MSTLSTIKAGSDKLVTASAQQLTDDLVHPIVRVYVYVGGEQDAGWAAALTACGWLGVQPYLASDMSLLRPWVPEGDASGVVFGTDDVPDRLLTPAEAAIEKIVRKANAAAI